MKIIFLDIDGVLNSIKTFIERNSKKELELDEEKIILLKEIVDSTDAKIVLISSWRYFLDKNLRPLDNKTSQLLELFNKHGINLYDKTTIKNDREEEIIEWIYINNPENFIIIDDSNYEILKDHLIKTYFSNNEFLGLCNKHVEESINMLNKKILKR